MGGVLTIASWVLPARSPAAQRVTLTYGAIERSVAVADLAVFAETGEFPASAHEFAALLRFVGLAESEARTQLQTQLSEPIAFDLLELDAAAYSQVGEDFLFLLGQVIYTRPRVAPITSLRGAILTAIADDGELSILEILERFPTPELVIDGRRILTGNWLDPEELENLTRQFYLEILQPSSSIQN